MSRRGPLVCRIRPRAGAGGLGHGRAPFGGDRRRGDREDLADVCLWWPWSESHLPAERARPRWLPGGGCGRRRDPGGRGDHAGEGDDRRTSRAVMHRMSNGTGPALTQGHWARTPAARPSCCKPSQRNISHRRLARRSWPSELSWSFRFSWRLRIAWWKNAPHVRKQHATRNYRGNRVGRKREMSGISGKAMPLRFPHACRREKCLPWWRLERR
jgi:hypothetical protein